MSVFKKIWDFIKELLGMSNTDPVPVPTPTPTPTPTPKPGVTIVWINQSNGSLSDSDAAKIVEALNLQMPHLEQYYSNLTVLTHELLPAGQTPPNGSQTLVKAYWLPDADQAGALGYHDVDPQGDPYIRVFTDTILQAKGTALTGALSISVCSSHEACEEAVDPTCQATAVAPNGDVWALETCDPVENNSYDVTLSDGSVVSMSDFVTPAFFKEPSATGQSTSQYDYDNVLTAPFTIAAGGYAIINNQDVFGFRYPEAKKATKTFPVARTARRHQNGSTAKS